MAISQFSALSGCSSSSAIFRTMAQNSALAGDGLYNTPMRMGDYYQKNRRMGLLGAIGLAALLAFGWAFRRRSDAPAYLTARVERGNITSVVQATGTITPLTTGPGGWDV